MQKAKVRVPVATDLNLKTVIMHETINIEFVCHSRCETLNNGDTLTEGLISNVTRAPVYLFQENLFYKYFSVIFSMFNLMFVILHRIQRSH